MTKLKIRQYWSAHGRPWYVIRFGHGTHQYLTAPENELKSMIKEGLKLGRFMAQRAY